MTIRINRVLPALLALLFASALSACGGGGDEPPPDRLHDRLPLDCQAHPERCT